MRQYTSVREYSGDTLHEELLRDVLQQPLNEEGALLWMMLLHSHSIRLRAPLLADLPGGTDLHGLTWNGAADVIAKLWPDRTDQRADPNYWFWEIHSRRYPESARDLPPEMYQRLLQLREQLAAHPDVASVIEEL